MLKRAIIAVGLFIAGSTSGFAAVCSAPPAGLPTGQDFATSTSSGGTLNGFVAPDYPATGGWTTCVASGMSYAPFDNANNTVFTSDAFIPFTPAAAEEVTISVSELTETGNTFELFVNNNYVTGTVGTSLNVDVTSTLNVLGILETYGAGNTDDTFSVAITRDNFIPEPATLGLLSFGAASLLLARRRRRPA